ncbi:MAG TPA: phosphotransferase family protein [Pyrinomonadaceae bacterium]|jgi:aminoglycoside phosphotransferase (APT) family kinase protein
MVQADLLDKPGPVRQGEQLDEPKLRAYLHAQLPDLAGPLTLAQFPAGFSNLTYLVRAGAREFVLRRPPFGAQVKTAHDMGREYLILSRLYPVYAKVPRPVLYCADETILGAPFYLMERVRGIILRAHAPAGVELSPSVMRRLSESFIQNLVEIHAVDFAGAGLGELGRAEGYVQRQIAGWTKRYYAARTDDVPAVEQLARWLSEHTPPDSGRALIHNDYKYDNVVCAPDELARIVAVLDWEMATIGDPLMDLGTTLGYWVEPDDPAEWQQVGFGLTARAGNLRRHDLIDYYARRSGRDVRAVVFYFAYGLLKIAVIVQQIYYRYRQGHTTDARFAQLGLLVRACGQLAQRAIEKNRVDGLG